MHQDPLENQLVSHNPRDLISGTMINNFKKSIIQDRALIDNYEDETEKKFTIRYVVGSEEKTLNGKELNKFKEDFIHHIRSNNLEIIE